MLLVLALILLLILPAGAHAETRVARAGPVEATLTWHRIRALEVRDVRLAVARDGIGVYEAPVALAGCEGPLCRPAGEEPLRAVDLDGDREPEVLLDVYSGGAHCCVFTRVLRWTGAEYVAADRGFRDAGYELRDLDGDGLPEFRSADARFAYAFASYAASGLPLQVLRFRAGAFEDVTAAFPALLRRDAADWLRRYRSQARRRDGEPLGLLAAWAADQYRLGRRGSALRFVRREARAGRLRGQGGGRRFPARLDRFLRRLGYASPASRP